MVQKAGDDNTEQLKRARVPHLRGMARIASADGDFCTVEVTSENDKKGKKTEPIVGKNVLLATGSNAVRMPCIADHYEQIPPQPLRVFDSDSMKALNFLPRSVAIVGGGIIAV